MPNWCDNVAFFYHKDGALVDRLFNATRNGKLLSEFIPMPEDIGDGWYDWCLDNWGTKWEVSHLDADHYEYYIYPLPSSTDCKYQIRVTFESARNPPINFYKTMEQMGWRIVATYCEPGLCFCGRYNDESWSEWSMEDPDVPESIREEYGYQFRSVGPDADKDLSEENEQ